MSALRRYKFSAYRGPSLTLVIVAGDGTKTGVEHPGCDHLAAVTPQLDVAFCNCCYWQCRLSGQWFMDLWEQAANDLYDATHDHPDIDGNGLPFGDDPEDC